tara:strand:- start:398 stop:559 length:162 start_codon:yes stop_codon:yes gene_type:complete
METVAIIVFIGVGFAAGLYVASQIGEGIDNRIRNKEFMDNLEKFEKDKDDKRK